MYRVVVEYGNIRLPWGENLIPVWKFINGERKLCLDIEDEYILKEILKLPGSKIIESPPKKRTRGKHPTKIKINVLEELKKKGN